MCCGAVSQYDSEAGFSVPGPRGVPGLLVSEALRMEGFIVLDHAPAAPVGLLAGEDVGKRMARVGPDPARTA